MASILIIIQAHDGWRAFHQQFAALLRRSSNKLTVETK